MSDKEHGFYDLHRKPLRRFEDLGNTKIKNNEMISIKREEYLFKIKKEISVISHPSPCIRYSSIRTSTSAECDRRKTSRMFGHRPQMHGKG